MLIVIVKYNNKNQNISKLGLILVKLPKTEKSSFAGCKRLKGRNPYMLLRNYILVTLKTIPLSILLWLGGVDIAYYL